MAIQTDMLVHIKSFMCDLYISSLVIFYVLELANICKLGTEIATKIGKVVFIWPLRFELYLVSFDSFGCPRDCQYSQKRNRNGH